MRNPTPPPRRPDRFDAPAPPPEAHRTAEDATPGNYWDFCPNCGARLYNAGCKYRCPRCHYFLSCSDYD